MRSGPHEVANGGSYFTVENDVGVRSMLLTLETIGPSRSLSARAEIQAGSAWKAVQPDDPATLIYTSGTTGPPKGVVITHRNALWTAASVQRWSAPGEEGRWPDDPRYLSYLPLAHSFERLSGHYNALWRGLHVHFCPEVLEVVAYLPEVRPFSFVAVPRLWEKAHAGISAAIAAETNQRRRQLAERAIETGRQAVRLRLAGAPVPLGLRLRLALRTRKAIAAASS